MAENDEQPVREITAAELQERVRLKREELARAPRPPAMSPPLAEPLLESQQVDAYEREATVTPLAELIERVKNNVEAKIAAKEASGALEAELCDEAKREAEREERERMMRLMTRQIPARAARVLLSADLDLETPAMRATRDFMAGLPGSFAISGGVGCGKTLAAAWAVAHKVRDRYLGAHVDGRDGTWPADYHPRFVDAARLARLPRFAGKGESLAALAPYEKCSVLAIDDVGNENDEFFAGILDSLIVTRHEDGLRTILTTNMKAVAFELAYGARVKDRVVGSGGFFQLNEPSRRGR